MACPARPRIERTGRAGIDRAAWTVDARARRARIDADLRGPADLRSAEGRGAAGCVLDRIYARYDAGIAGARCRAGLRAGTFGVCRRDAGGPAIAVDDLQGLRGTGRLAAVAGRQSG